MALAYMSDNELRAFTKPGIQRLLKEGNIPFLTRLNKPDLVVLYKQNMRQLPPSPPRRNFNIEEEVERAIRTNDVTEFRRLANRGLINPNMRVDEFSLLDFAILHLNSEIILIILNLPGIEVTLEMLRAFHAYQYQMNPIDAQTIRKKLMELIPENIAELISNT